MAYIGSPFIATEEARASDAYKQMIVDSSAADIVYSNCFTGIHGNYLKASIRAAGMDPDSLPEADPSKMDFDQATDGAKAWKDIWGCGQGIGAIREIGTVGQLVDRLEREYDAARARLGLAFPRGLDAPKEFSSSRN
jgi:nitronate monooxygenase